MPANLSPTMKPGMSPFIEYWDKGQGAKVRAKLEPLAIRPAPPIRNVSVPDWLISVDGGDDIQLPSIHIAVGDMTKWFARVRSSLYGDTDHVALSFEFTNDDTSFHNQCITFWDWTGTLWQATIPPIQIPSSPVQPLFNIYKP
jgi:hypothetical protein